MNLMKCPNGHHYDASRFSSCPFCGMEGVNVGPDQTTVPLDVPVSQPGPSVATEPLSTAIPDDDDRTLPVTADMLDGATEKSAPVVGWLVCTEGVNLRFQFCLLAIILCHQLLVLSFGQQSSHKIFVQATNKGRKLIIAFLTTFQFRLVLLRLFFTFLFPK